MTHRYFNVKIEFDREVVDQTIEDAIRMGKKGYVCSIERMVMATANSDPAYLEVVNNALVNICDGNFVAKTIGWAHRRRFGVYIGADLFLDYIKKGAYRHYFLGNTEEVLEGLRENLCTYDPKIKDMCFRSLPFAGVREFDYAEIARGINQQSPDIIWVSLGAPKQEVFMSMLLPHIQRGVMFGFGAIFNFNSGIPGQKRAPAILLRYKLEWLYRMYQEPRKNLVKNWTYLRMVPRLIRDERRRLSEL